MKNLIPFSNQEFTPETPVTFGQRFPLYLRIGWSLIVLFAFVGHVTGHTEYAMTIFVITAIMWTVIRIGSEGFDALTTLTAARKHNDMLKKAKKDDSQPPTYPPTAAA